MFFFNVERSATKDKMSYRADKRTNVFLTANSQSLYTDKGQHFTLQNVLDCQLICSWITAMYGKP